MDKRTTAIILLAALAFSLCGCSSMFEKEYVVIEDYVPAIPQEISADEKVVVKNFSSLKQAIQRWVSEGRTDGDIIFDSEYVGNASEDMASACWQIRTQNAICAYCVDNISYEVSRIVAYDEAAVHISYADFGVSVEDIVRLTFSSGVDELLLKAINNSADKLAVYILNGTYTAESMENLVLQVYHDHPVCTPKEPKVNINIYSGTGMQRLYELEFDYGISADQLQTRKKELAEFSAFSEEDIAEPDMGKRALSACVYLTENCELSDSSQDNNAYSALINKCGNSEGLALAYVELCRELGLNCKIVYGQKDWESHCWNIVTVSGSNYHVDVSECITNGMKSGFLLNDQRMWSRYRWDISAYPVCTGELTCYDVMGIPEMIEEQDSAEVPVDEQQEETEESPAGQPEEKLPEGEQPQEDPYAEGQKEESFSEESAENKNKNIKN